MRHISAYSASTTSNSTTRTCSCWVNSCRRTRALCTVKKQRGCAISSKKSSRRSCSRRRGSAWCPISTRKRCFSTIPSCSIRSRITCEKCPTTTTVDRWRPTTSSSRHAKVSYERAETQQNNNNRVFLNHFLFLFLLSSLNCFNFYVFNKNGQN